MKRIFYPFMLLFLIVPAVTGAEELVRIYAPGDAHYGKAVCIEVVDSSVGSDQFHTTTPGHKYVDEVTLRGPLTSGRKALCTRVDPAARCDGGSAEDLTIDDREMTTGADWDYRVAGPGDAHFGSITVRARSEEGDGDSFRWVLDCGKGDGSGSGRSHGGREFPTRWDAGDYSPSSNVRSETVVAKMGRVELQ